MKLKKKIINWRTSRQALEIKNTILPSIKNYANKILFCVLYGALYLLVLRFLKVQLTFMNLLSATALYLIVEEFVGYIIKIKKSKWGIKKYEIFRIIK